MTRPRIAPVPIEERVGPIREALNRLLPTGFESSPTPPDRNLPCTVIKHPVFYEAWLTFAISFRTGELPVKDRELVTLRVAHRVGSPYEWAHHTRSARIEGVTDDEIAAVVAGPDAWDDLTAAKLRAVDEIYDLRAISQETWNCLAQVYSERQLIELMMLIGFYSMTGWMLNSLDIEIDDWIIDQA
jgi:AhpD family alkylhydroperoxidase